MHSNWSARVNFFVVKALCVFVRWSLNFDHGKNNHFDKKINPRIIYINFLKMIRSELLRINGAWIYFCIARIQIAQRSLIVTNRLLTLAFSHHLLCRSTWPSPKYSCFVFGKSVPIKTAEIEKETEKEREQKKGKKK